VGQINHWRADQVEREREASCLLDGSPATDVSRRRQLHASDGTDGGDGGSLYDDALPAARWHHRMLKGGRSASEQDSSNDGALSVEHFFGLFLILFVLVSVALCVSYFQNTLGKMGREVGQRMRSARTFTRSKSARGLHRATSEQRANSPGRKNKRKAQLAIKDIMKPAPSTHEWRESVDARLGALDRKLEKHRAHFDDSMAKVLTAVRAVGMARDLAESLALRPETSAERSAQARTTTIFKDNLAARVRRRRESPLSDDDTSKLSAVKSPQSSQRSWLDRQPGARESTCKEESSTLASTSQDPTRRKR